MSDNVKRQNKREIKRLAKQTPVEFVLWLKALPLDAQTREIETAKRNLGLLTNGTESTDVG